MKYKEVTEIENLKRCYVTQVTTFTRGGRKVIISHNDFEKVFTPHTPWYVEM